MEATAPSSVVDADSLRDKKLPLMEVFGPTIQGEGFVIGQQTYFLRFGLCDYKCKMCDSWHAVDGHSVSENAEWLTQSEIFDKLHSLRSGSLAFSTDWVTLSGGNPCIHDLYHLCSLLQRKNWQIAVETQGTFAPGWLHTCDVVTVSPKTPGMGEAFELEKYMYFLRKLRGHRGLNIKIVVFNQADLEFARRVFELSFTHVPIQRMFLSQGNPLPNNLRDSHEMTNILRTNYLVLFDMIKQDVILSRVKFLPQFHVWLFGTMKGV